MFATQINEYGASTIEVPQVMHIDQGLIES